DIVVSTEAGQIHMGYGGIYNMNWKTIITGLAMRAAPSSCDWDGDGNSEVFVGTEEGKVLIINGSTGKVARVLDVNEGISKATGEVYTTNRIRNPVALADIARNKVIDLLISSTSGNYLAMEGNSLARIWHEQWPHDFDSKAQYLTPSLGDVDGDRIDDVVLVSNRRIKVIKGVGNTKTRKQVLWEFNLDNKDVFVTPATLADVNKDKSNDIIIGSMRGTIHILSGKNGEIITQINNDGNPPVSPLLVADLEDDGYMDVLLIRKDLNIYKIQTNSSIQKSSVIWGQVFSNAQHTSKLDYESPGTVSYDLYITASGFMLFCVIITNIAARKKRQQLILRNQST
ncbi:MAG: FG-GAP repeat domain-containing protein, partial [bacterium]